MNAPSKSILISGDTAVDWFFYPVEPEKAVPNWRQIPAMHATVLPGGVNLLAEFTRQIAATEPEVPIRVAGPAPGYDELRKEAPENVIHSNAILFDPHADDKKKRNELLRIREGLGFMGPPKGIPTLPADTSEPENVDVIVLDDAGNGFRNQPKAWPKALEDESGPWIVHKVSHPLPGNPPPNEEAENPPEGALWGELSQHHSAKRVTVVTAEALRQLPGVQLGSGLSWERTAIDFAFQIQRSPRLMDLQRCPYLVVMLGIEGAILFRGDEPGTPMTLIFDPVHLENTFQDSISGSVYGLTAIFSATVAVGLAARGIESLEDSIKRGLHFSRCFLERGYHLKDGQLAIPGEEDFRHCAGDSSKTFASCEIVRPLDYEVADPKFWRILNAKTRNTWLPVAEEMVTTGGSEKLKGVPVGEFGKLRTIDRAEIESYNAIRRLIAEFLHEPHPERPLCFAVFGPPGSGKSFGVKQVMASLGRDDLEDVTFNISQFLEYDELVSSLHRVRDVVLSGKVPFVFFDEFDAAFDGQPLGWLKYFLAPMQDGEFKDGENVFHIGRAVFVFAGGTRSTFGEFVENSPPKGDDSPPDPSLYGAAPFRQAKGPDFASRLRGFIDIMGPNRRDADDDAFIIRRANVLSFLLGKLRDRAGRLFEPESGDLQIDGGVRRAFLNVSRYRHGTRSMEAIISMSRLAGRTRFDLSALPPKDQLDLHVDKDEFLFLAERERFVNLIPPRDWPGRSEDSASPSGNAIAEEEFGPMQQEKAIIEAIAREIHEDYRCQRKLRGQEGTVDDWDKLLPEKRKSNRDAASHIPTKIRLVEHGIRRIGDSGVARIPDISDEELEKLASAEHDRWCGEQKLQGYRYGEPKDEAKKVSPYLISFGKLEPDIRAYDREAVQAISRILATLGFEIYRMEEVDRLRDGNLIEQLARLVHDEYVRQRQAEGDTPETNSSMKAFDDLDSDFREANFDNARSIPRKLKRIGYGLRRAPGHREPQPLELDKEQIEELSKMEHARWNWQKVMQGWTHKEGDKDPEKKTTPHLVPWKDLPDTIREYDRETVRLIPSLLKAAGFEAYQLEP